MSDTSQTEPKVQPRPVSKGPLFFRDRDWHPAAYTPGYKTSMTRAPFRPLVALGSTLSEETGPAFGHSMIGELDNNLIMNFTGQPAIGERIIMHGRVLDETGRGVPNVLVEIWQANAGGRYRHKKDAYAAPLDPNFGGCGRTIAGRVWPTAIPTRGRETTAAARRRLRNLRIG